MAGSSELSDALNPYFYSQWPQSQSSSDVSPVSDQHTSVPTSSAPAVTQQHAVLQSFTSQRDDLAGVMTFSPGTTSHTSLSKQSRQPSADALHLLKGLIQSIASYKAAVEQEKKRRLTWEQEQEIKHITRQAELEKRIQELEQELETFRTNHAESQTSLPTKKLSPFPEESVVLFDPKDDNNDLSQPEFVEGSSSSSSMSNMRKRARSGSPNNGTEHEPMKLRTTRTSRPQTIQSAMRNHILRCMDLDHDRELPASHSESVKLPPTRPVRFVWDQTTKKSAHNNRMKARVVADMISNQELYPLVPAQEFTKVKLESVFEQAYTTLRQKYMSQRGLKASAKDTAESKARKARRMSRKKTKLANRNATREGLDRFSVAAFDAAFQLDCMSSEESSDGEGDSTNTDKPPTVKALRIRCLAWRSSRLQELFRAIDEQEQLNRGTKPKRGVGRKDRYLGPPKDGNPPPPKGIPAWMVSKRWLRHASDFNGQITALVVPNDDNADQQAIAVLGDESEDEEETAQCQDYAQMPEHIQPVIEPPLTMTSDPYQHAQYMYPHLWTNDMSAYVDLSQFSSPLLQTYASTIPHS